MSEDKAKKVARDKRYDASPKGRARRRRANTSHKGRERYARYRHSPKGRENDRLHFERKNKRRVYAGERYLGLAETASMAEAINAHAKSRIRAFLKDHACHSVETLDKSAS